MVESSICKIGVLALQGDVIEHIDALQEASKKLSIPISIVEVRTPSNLSEVKGLVLPGGESTTIGKLLKLTGLDDEIIKRTEESSLALYGTCAGAILLSKKIVGKQQAENLGLIDIEIERNAFGRQLDSFRTELEVDSVVSEKKVDAFFIRAPRIKSTGPAVEVLSKFEDEPVLIQQNKILVSTFHPELTADTTIHEYFLKLSTQ